MEKTVYTPKVFNKENIEEAKKIILTQEGTLETNTRWENETPFLVDDIINNLDVKENQILLDFGCGIGRIAKELIAKTSCKVIGVDISESMRKMALEYVDSDNFQAISPEVLELNMKKGFRVDSAYSIWVLQHCIQPQNEIDLIKKSLKKDSLFYIVNNNQSAIPTNNGWINNGTNILELLTLRFESLKQKKIPVEKSSKKINENTFIGVYKNSKGFSIPSSNEKVIELIKEANEKYSKKDLKASKEIFLKALELDDKNIEILGNLGVVSKALGQTVEAISYYVKSIKINPNNSHIYNNLGNAFKQLKDYKRALLAFSDCIKRDPKNFNAYNNLGIVYEVIGDSNKAIQAYKKAVEINPKYSRSINNIGVVLYKQKKYDEAAQIFQIALNVDPEYYELYSNMGACLNKAKKYDEAITALDTAIKHNPKNGGAYTNLGNVYNKIYDYKKAAKMHEKSIELEPNGSNAYSNVGTSYKYLGQAKKSIDSYKKAIELEPNFVNAHFDLSTMYLAKGDYLNGFIEYEWRFKKDEMLSHMENNKDIFSKPMYNGIDLIEGKTLLIHSEQGFGDSIQFIRFIPELKKRLKCKIAVKCRDELSKLFETMEGIDILSNRSEPTPKFDYHLPIMSMPKILGIKTPSELKFKTPYLDARDDKEFENIKKQKGKLNIGICWSASVTGESYDGKVFDLTYLEPLINSNKINLYSLQVGPERKDIKKFGFEDKIIDLTPKLSDFSKTASMMKKLDLVISSDTSVAHLAGAINVPVWIPLQKFPDWRWEQKGEKSSWYPSAKLFRQKTDRVWNSVFQSIYDKLFSYYKIKVKHMEK